MLKLLANEAEIPMTSDPHTMNHNTVMVQVHRIFSAAQWVKASGTGIHRIEVQNLTPYLLIL